jgi:hypothetical protein
MRLAKRASARQKRRRDALRSLWSKESLVLLTAALTAVLLAFAFYDYPIINDTQIISYLRGAISSPAL